MAEHDCTQTENIQKLLRTVLDGNGQPSLVQLMAGISSQLDTYMKRQEDIISQCGIFSKEFYEFRSHVSTVEVEREKSEMRKRWRTGVLVSALAVILTILTTLFVNRTKVLASRIDSHDIQSWSRGVDSLPLPKIN
jgi:hypothetical protein